MNKNTEKIKPVHLDFISPTPAHAVTHQKVITHVKLLNRFHPGALKYYKEMDLEIAEPVQLSRMG